MVQYTEKESDDKLSFSYDKFMNLVSKTTNLIVEKGGGTVIAGIGLVMIIITWFTYVFPDILNSSVKNELSNYKYVVSLITGLILALIGVYLRIYAQIKTELIKIEKLKILSNERISLQRKEEDEITRRRELEENKQIEIEKQRSTERKDSSNANIQN